MLDVMSARVIRTASAIGIVGSGLAAAISIGQSVGELPTTLFLSGSSNWSSGVRLGAVPIELFMLFVFVGAFFLHVVPAMLKAQSSAPPTFLAVSAVAGFGVWHLIDKNSTCWPVLLTTLAAATILGTVAASDVVWPDNLGAAIRSDCTRLTASRVARAWTGIGVIVAAAAVTSIQLLAGRVSPEEAYDRALRRWFTDQVAIDVGMIGAQAIRVVAFTDYQAVDRDAVTAGATIVAEFAARNVPIEYVVQDFPEDPVCNRSTKSAGHPAACEAAMAVRFINANSGEQAGHAMSAWLIARGPSLSQAAIANHLRELYVSDEFGARSSALRQQLTADVEHAIGLGITHAPTFLVDGIRIPNGRGVLKRILGYQVRKRRFG